MLALWASLACGGAHAGSLRWCDRPAELDATQQDRLLRFGAIIKAELEASGQRAALIARSGLDLRRFGERYSHAGVSLKAGPQTPWSVRELYYACDERRPHVYDEGLAGFLLGTGDPALGYVSVLLLPPREAEALEHAALDARQALDVLAPAYSANAYAFSERYQNCNQWVAELIATAWSAFDPADADRGRRRGADAPPADATAASSNASDRGPGDDSLRPPATARAKAQHWLAAHSYAPRAFELSFPPLMWLGAFIPWLHSDDHPAENLARAVYRVSMPSSIEAFVHAQVPGTRRLEFCHDEHRAVVHPGWTPIAEGCVPQAGDTVVPLD